MTIKVVTNDEVFSFSSWQIISTESFCRLEFFLGELTFEEEANFDTKFLPEALYNLYFVDNFKEIPFISQKIDKISFVNFGTELEKKIFLYVRGQDYE